MEFYPRNAHQKYPAAAYLWMPCSELALGTPLRLPDRVSFPFFSIGHACARSDQKKTLRHGANCLTRLAPIAFADLDLVKSGWIARFNRRRADPGGRMNETMLSQIDVPGVAHDQVDERRAITGVAVFMREIGIEVQRIAGL